MPQFLNPVVGFFEQGGGFECLETQFMGIPGVGEITALSFKAAVDDPARFKRSRTVGAHFGLTPRRFQSGEKDNPGESPTPATPTCAPPSHPIVGMTKLESACSSSLSGQRPVTVLTLVQNFTPSMPCWLVSPKAERFQPPKV